MIGALPARPAAALIAAGKLRLSHDPGFNPTPDSTIADLDPEEVVFTGYPAGGGAPTMSASVNLNGTTLGSLGAVLFEATAADPQVTDTAYGWWIDDGTLVCCYERFPNGTSFGFAIPGDFLELVACAPFPLGVDVA